VGGPVADLAAATAKGEGEKEGVCDRTITDLDGSSCLTSKKPMKMAMQRMPPSVAKPTLAMQRATRKCRSKIGNRKDTSRPKQPLAQTTKPMMQRSSLTAMSVFDHQTKIEPYKHVAHLCPCLET
jgi:hypothetical protein